MKRILFLVCVVSVVFSVGVCAHASQLKDTCDYVLSEGYDTNGNYYEMVANQKENARGFEISVGIIKNNQWIYPLSTSFPFLGEDGLFHVTPPYGGDSGKRGLSDVGSVNAVRDKILFIDSGAFSIEIYEPVETPAIYTEKQIFFSCATLKSYTFDCDDGWIEYLYNETEFNWDHEVERYGRIYTDNGIIGLVKENRGFTGWDNTYDTFLLDTKTLTTKQITANWSEYPLGGYYDGLILFSDNCFYNENGNKVIDLSDYNIDYDSYYGYESGDPVYSFWDGEFTFVAVNGAGSYFRVTIDKQGNVINEEKIW